jgi:hypothetical protein
MRKTIALVLLGVGVSALAFSQGKGHHYGRGHDAPEIGATSAASALTLLAGALIVLRARRKK